MIFSYHWLRGRGHSFALNYLGLLVNDSKFLMISEIVQVDLYKKKKSVNVELLLETTEVTIIFQYIDKKSNCCFQVYKYGKTENPYLVFPKDFPST